MPSLKGKRKESKGQNNSKKHSATPKGGVDSEREGSGRVRFQRKGKKGKINAWGTLCFLSPEVGGGKRESRKEGTGKTERGTVGSKRERRLVGSPMLHHTSRIGWGSRCGKAGERILFQTPGLK